MKRTRPAFYDRFRCLAGACPDSCCHEWAVVVDPEKAALYRSLPGPLGDDLRAALIPEDGDTVLALRDGRCPMWRRDGLCRIQAELGQEALCETCRDFPRLTHDYGPLVEQQLELSCPEAARLILQGDDRLLTQDLPGGDAPWDGEALALLLQSRDRVLALLRDDRPVEEALAAMLLYAHSVQGQLDGGPATAPGDSDARQLAGQPDVEALLQFFRGLEVLTDRWRLRLAAPRPVAWCDAFKPLARYFVSRYWLQAVSDRDLIARAKLILVSCIVIRTLGGDLAQTAQLYAKEIENDADSLDAILDGAYTNPALTDRSLLALLFA